MDMEITSKDEKRKRQEKTTETLSIASPIYLLLNVLSASKRDIPLVNLIVARDHMRAIQ